MADSQLTSYSMVKSWKPENSDKKEIKDIQIGKKEVKCLCVQME